MTTPASTPLETIIAQRQAIRALIDQEDEEDKVAELTADEDDLLIELAHRREPSDDAFFAKAAYLLASRVAEFGEPNIRDPFDVVAIALRRHLEQRPREA
jgi:hypothetical protein